MLGGVQPNDPSDPTGSIHLVESCYLDLVHQGIHFLPSYQHATTDFRYFGMDWMPLDPRISWMRQFHVAVASKGPSITDSLSCRVSKV